MVSFKKFYHLKILKICNFTNPIKLKISSYIGYRLFEDQSDKMIDKSFMINNYLIYNKKGDALDANSIVTPVSGDKSIVKNGKMINVKDIDSIDSYQIKAIHNNCFVSFLRVLNGIFLIINKVLNFL